MGQRPQILRRQAYGDEIISDGADCQKERTVAFPLNGGGAALSCAFLLLIACSGGALRRARFTLELTASLGAHPRWRSKMFVAFSQRHLLPQRANMHLD